MRHDRWEVYPQRGSKKFRVRHLASNGQIIEAGDQGHHKAYAIAKARRLSGVDTLQLIRNDIASALNLLGHGAKLTEARQLINYAMATIDKAEARVIVREKL